MTPRQIAMAAAVTLGAVLAVQYAGTTPGISVQWTPTDGVRETAMCVMPDCARDGGMGPVRCFATGVYGTRDGGPKWRGCNVIPARLAVGDECLPSACVYRAGNRMERRRGAYRETYRSGETRIEIAEPTSEDGGRLVRY